MYPIPTHTDDKQEEIEFVNYVRTVSPNKTAPASTSPLLNQKKPNSHRLNLFMATVYDRKRKDQRVSTTETEPTLITNEESLVIETPIPRPPSALFLFTPMNNSQVKRIHLTLSPTNAARETPTCESLLLSQKPRMKTQERFRLCLSIRNKTTHCIAQGKLSSFDDRALRLGTPSPSPCFNNEVPTQSRVFSRLHRGTSLLLDSPIKTAQSFLISRSQTPVVGIAPKEHHLQLKCDASLVPLSNRKKYTQGMNRKRKMKIKKATVIAN